MGINILDMSNACPGHFLSSRKCEDLKMLLYGNKHNKLQRSNSIKSLIVLDNFQVLYKTWETWLSNIFYAGIIMVPATIP